MIVLILPIALLLGTAVVIAASESPEIYHAIKRKNDKRKRFFKKRTHPLSLFPTFVLIPEHFL